MSQTSSESTYEIFISYRRDDSGPVAARLREHLIPRFGTERIYLDLESNTAGHDWRARIDHALTSCRAVIVLIGHGWATVCEPSGEPRLHGSEDYVRFEVRRALQGDKLLFPVLIDDAQMPAAHLLPEDIRPLSHLQASRLRQDESWAANTLRLAENLQDNGVAPTVDQSGRPASGIILGRKEYRKTFDASAERLFHAVKGTILLSNYRNLAADPDALVAEFVWGATTGPSGRIFGRMVRMLGKGNGITATVRTMPDGRSAELVLSIPTVNWMAKAAAAYLTHGIALSLPILERALGQMFLANVEAVLAGRGLRYESVAQYLKAPLKRI